MTYYFTFVSKIEIVNILISFFTIKNRVNSIPLKHIEKVQKENLMAKFFCHLGKKSYLCSRIMNEGDKQSLGIGIIVIVKESRKYQ